MSRSSTEQLQFCIQYLTNHLTANMNSQSVSIPIALGEEGTRPVSCNKGCQVSVLRPITFVKEQCV